MENMSLSDALTVNWRNIACVTVAFVMLLVPISVRNGSQLFTANISHAQATTGTNSGGSGPTQAATQSGQSTTVTSCNGLSGLKPSCWIDVIATWAAALVISIAVTILEMIGWLFNLSISYTVLGFKDLISGGVLTAISTGWTFFRDIANIVLIGLFVYIAITIILGINSYGQKSLIARVLIVAVLLNFSFLFTRIVINFSNALAVQFAKIQPLSAEVTSLGTKPPDIAGKYTELMGLKGLSQTKGALAEISAKNNSTLVSLMHAFMVTVIVLGVAIVLLYGALLLIVRAVILIFLLVTSSLAFATYLHPSLATSEFGWKAWWIALFRNALLAPIMMLFLAVTLQIGQGLVAALNPSGQGASNSGIGFLGALATNPGDPKNESALLFYIIILGLLYGAIRISNRFSGAAGQFAWSGVSPFANATVAWPSRSLGLLGRNTIGRGAMRVSDALMKGSQGENRGATSRWALQGLSQQFNKLAKRDFNAGNLTNIKSAKTTVGGIEGREKALKENFDAIARRITPKDDKLDKKRKDVIEQARRENPTAAAEADKNKVALEAAQKNKEAAEKELKAAEMNKENLGQEIRGLEIQKRGATDDKKSAIDRQISDRQEQMRHAQNNIDTARDNARVKSQVAADIASEGKQFTALLEKRAQELMPSGWKYKDVDPNTGGNMKYQDRLQRAAVEQAESRFSNVLGRALGANDKLAESMREFVRENSKKKDKKENLDILKDAIKENTNVTRETSAKTKEAINNSADHAAHNGGGDHH